MSYRSAEGAGTVTYHALGMSLDGATGRTYLYKAHVLDALARHGLVPKPTTSPERLREFLNDLYRYELRRLRDCLVRNEFPRSDYSGRVIELRRRYQLMSVPVQFWIE
jgi:hypothetical protein